MKNTFSIEQIKAMLGKMTSNDKALFVSLLLCGSKARTWTWEDALSDVVSQPFAVYQALRNMAISKKLTIFPFNTNSQMAKGFHLVGGVQLQRPIFGSRLYGEPFTTHEVTRRLKRYARLAGIDCRYVSLRTAANTHHVLLDLFGSADEAAERFGVSPLVANERPIGVGILWAQVEPKREPRLHGIGRRSLMKSA